MYNSGLKMIIMDQVNKCSYPQNSREYMVTAIMDTIGFPDKTSQPKTLPTKIGNDVIIVVYFPMSIPFQAVKLEVTVKIFFMKNVPYEPPQFFVETNQNLRVNTRNVDIDPNNGRIMVPSLRSWNQYCTFRQVLEEIKKSFSTTFPIFKVNKPQLSSTMPPYANYQQNQGAGGAFPRPTSIYGQSMVGNNPAARPPYQQQQPPARPPYQQQQQPVARPPYQQQQSTMPAPVHSPYQQQQSTVSHSSIYANQQRPLPGVPGYTVGTSTNPQVKAPYMNQQVNQQVNQPQMQPAKTNYQEYQTEDPEKQLKNVLIESCFEKVKEPINKEKKSLEQQKGKLNNYQSQFNTEIEKITQFTNTSGNINQYCQEEMNKIDREIETKRDYLMKNGNVELNGETFMNYLVIDSPDKQEMVLIAKEASYVDLLTIIKKGCEKGAMNYEEGKKLVKLLSKDLFRVSYKRKKVCGNED